MVLEYAKIHGVILQSPGVVPSETKGTTKKRTPPTGGSEAAAKRLHLETPEPALSADLIKLERLLDATRLKLEANNLMTAQSETFQPLKNSSLSSMVDI